MSSNKITRRILVIPDTHAPYHDAKAFELVSRVARGEKPTDAVVIGDFADCAAVSSHPKTPERKFFWQDELDTARALLARVRGWSDVLHFIEGNHETRLSRYVMDNAPELHGSHPSIRELLGVEKREWTAYREHKMIGKVAFTHDVGHSGPGALSQTLTAVGSNVVFGHTHRLGVIYDGALDGTHRFAMSVGWLGDVSAASNMHKAKLRSWQLGFGWVNQTSSGLSFAQACPIVRGHVVVNGRLY